MGVGPIRGGIALSRLKGELRANAASFSNLKTKEEIRGSETSEKSRNEQKRVKVDFGDEIGLRMNH